MNLIFVKDETQLSQVVSNKVYKNKNYKIIPIMPKASLALIRQGESDVQLPIELLSKKEREAIHGQAIDLSKSWYRSLPYQAEYRGIDLLDCCRLQMMGFFQDIIAAEIITVRLVQQYKPKEAVFLKKPSIPSYEHPMHDGRADVFEAVLQYRFQQSGINLSIPNKYSAGINGRTGIAQSFYHYFRRRMSYAKRKLNPQSSPKQDPRRIKLHDIPKNKPLVVGYGSGYDLLVIWPYIKSIAKEINAFPVALNGSPTFDSNTLRSGLVLDEEFRFLFTGDIVLSHDDYQNFKTCKNSCLNALSDGDFLPQSLKNPLLSFQFELLWNMASGVLDAARRAASFFSDYKVVLYLDDYCAGHIQRVWTQTGNMVEVPTITVPHGAVNLVEFHEFNSKWAFAWGELGRTNWAIANQGKSDHIIVAGDPSMDILHTRFVSDSRDRRNKVLFLTAGPLHQVWTDMNLQGFISTWEELSQIAQKRPDIEFIIKPHPSIRDLGDWYRGFVKKKLIANIKVVDDQKLETLLPSAFFAVLVGKPGTAGLVTALAGVPFVYYDSGMLCRDVNGYRIWNDENGVPHLTSSVELARMVDRMYSSLEERNKLLKQNNYFSKRYLHPFQPCKVCKEIGLKE